MVRYGRSFTERVAPFSAFLSDWLDKESPATGAVNRAASPTCAPGMARIKWLIKSLVVIDPDGVGALRMFQKRALAGPQSKDERVWSRVIVELIDDAFREAEFPERHRVGTA